MLQRLFKRLSTLRMRLFIIAALCWLLPTLILGAYMGGVFFDSLRHNTETMLNASASHAQTQTITEIDRVIGMSKQATYDGTLETLTYEYDRAQINQSVYYRLGRQYLDQWFRRDNTVSFAIFYRTDNPSLLIYTQDDEAAVSHFIDKVQEGILQEAAELDNRCRFFYRDGQLYLVRNLLMRKPTGLRLEQFGTLVLGIRAENLFAPMYAAQEQFGGDMDLILDEYQLIQSEAFTFPDQARKAGMIEMGNHLCYVQRIVNSDYKFAFQFSINKSEAFAQVYQYYTLMYLLLLALLPVEAWIMVIIHRRISKPLRQLETASERMMAGELGIQVPVESDDEVGSTALAFNEMSRRIQTLIDKSYREEIILRDARIEALQSRINPHFLNNALEIINWQARIDGNDDICAMIDALSVLLNAGLDRPGTRVVPLSEELQVADAYFYFLSLRFGARLTLERTVDETLNDMLIPRLTIQTLLENAVEHGISPAGSGWIRLDIRKSGDHLEINVVNSGRHMSEKDKANIEMLLSQDSIDMHSEHLGLRNIHMRLKLLYAGRAKLSVMPDENGDTLAQIQIPLDSCASLPIEKKI